MAGDLPYFFGPENTLLFSKLCCTDALYRLLENLDASALFCSSLWLTDFYPAASNYIIAVAENLESPDLKMSLAVNLLYKEETMRQEFQVQEQRRAAGGGATPCSPDCFSA